MNKWNIKKITKFLWIITISSFILTIISFYINGDKLSLDKNIGISFTTFESSKSNKNKTNSTLTESMNKDSTSDSISDFNSGSSSTSTSSSTSSSSSTSTSTSTSESNSSITKSEINDTAEFTLSDIKSINLSSVSTDINIIPYNKSEIKIHFYGKGSSTNKELPYLETELSNGNLIAAIKYPKSSSFFNLTNLDAKIDLYIPEDFSKNLILHTTSADINIGNLASSDLSISSVSGKTTIDTLECGDFSLKTTSGEAKINSIKCKKSSFSSVSGELNSDSFASESLDFHTTSGELTLKEFAGSLSGSTVSGSVEIDYKTFDKSVDVSTTSGDVTVSLPNSSEFSVELNSTSGDFENEFPSKITKSNKRSLYGTVGDGSNKIKIKTVSGDISIKED